MAKRILVTGATGTVGSRIVKELSGKGARVRAGVHTRANAEKIKGPGVEIAEVDYTDKESVTEALKGVDTLYLLTPFVPDQVEISRLLVDEARAAGVKYIVKQSGMGIGFEPAITIGRLHREAEQYVEASGIPFTFLRPNFFMQNFINYFGPAMKGEGRIYLPLGEGRVSYVDASDVARVAATVLLNPGHEGMVYVLTGPEAISIEDVAREFTAVAGREITYVDVPEEAARKSMEELGMDGWSIEAMMGLHGACKKGLAGAVTNSVEEVTGSAAMDFKGFARDNAWFFETSGV
jgi:uncharacterized protein YbjT (DUF2867 family)